MALGGEVGDHVGPEPGDRIGHRRRVADIGLTEGVARIGGDRRQRGEVAGIGQFVDIEHAVRRRADQVAHQRRADEARPAGDEDA